MILNASHDITLRGLPSEILDAYVRYKKGSRAIVSWLVQFGPKRYKRVKTLPIKELASLAAAVTHSIKELPEVVHFHFRETIAARKRLSQFFRTSIDLSEEDADTVNHEHFTASLTKIYTDLCIQCRHQINHKEQRGHLVCSAALAGPIRNHYACLPVEDADEALVVDAQDMTCHECQHEESYQCPGPQVEIEIENDEMSTAIETASTLEHIHEVLTAVETSWCRLDGDNNHFVSAAGVSNVAWSTMQKLEHQLQREDNETLSVSILHQRCCLFRNSAEDSVNTLAKVHNLLDSLVEADRAITHYLDCHKLTVIANCPSCVQKPSDYVQYEKTPETEQTTSFTVALLDNILHLMCGSRPTPIILSGSPMFTEIRHLLMHRDDRTTSFRCVLGIHLLATTYKAYLSVLPKPSTISNCRIRALKLSKQAGTAIDEIIADKDSFPCRCSQTLAFHLGNLKDDMDTYSKHRCWDLYFQSPWVAGNHVIEMLDMLSYYGMRLLHYRHYMGAALHSYNILVQLAGLPKIAILEHLCDTFRDIFFPSGRPTSHFKNSWARYIGARLKFKKGQERHRNDRENWCMAVPAHAARNAAGLGIDKTDRGKSTIDPKCDYARIDVMMRLKQQNWCVDVFADQDCGIVRRGSASTSRPSSSSSSNTTRSEISSAAALSRSRSTSISTTSYSTSYTSSPANRALQALHQTLTTSIRSSQALATTPFNHIAVFAASVSVVRHATSKLHTDQDEKDTTKLCICFAHTLLSGADRIVEGRKFGGVECWRKEEREFVEVVKDALEMEFGDERTGLQKWMWEL